MVARPLGPGDHRRSPTEIDTQVQTVALTPSHYDPASDPEAAERSVSGSSDLRFWIYAHLTAVALSVFVSLADTGALGIRNPNLQWIAILVPPCILALFICPAATFSLAFRSNVTPTRRMIACLLSTVLTIAHFFALTPLVQ